MLGRVRQIPAESHSSPMRYALSKFAKPTLRRTGVGDVGVAFPASYGPVSKPGSNYASVARMGMLLFGKPSVVVDHDF